MSKEKKIPQLAKPKPPVMPVAGDFRWLTNGEYVEAYKNYLYKKERYEKDIYNYEQLKLIKLLKNSNWDYILKKYKIIKL